MLGLVSIDDGTNDVHINNSFRHRLVSQIGNDQNLFKTVGCCYYAIIQIKLIYTCINKFLTYFTYQFFSINQTFYSTQYL